MLLKNEFSMQVMKKDNEGVSLKPLNDKIKMKASQAFGGCTLLPSKGYWVDGETLFVDDSYRLIINFNADQKTIDHLLSLIKMELVGGRQEAVCFTVNGVTSISESIIEAQNDLNTLLYANSKKSVDNAN